MRIHPLHFDKHKAVHGAHVVCHVTYLVLCFVESHGLYGLAAGALSVVVVMHEAMTLKDEHAHVKGTAHGKHTPLRLEVKDVA
jgi:hypothetical protein